MTAPKDTRILSSQCVPFFLRHLEASGVDTANIRHTFALAEDASSKPELSMPLTSLWAFSSECAHAANDPNLGFTVARGLSRGQYGLIEFVLRSAPDLEGALQRLVRYTSLVNELVVLEVEPLPSGSVAVRHSVPGEPRVVGRECNEYFVALLGRLCRELVGDDFQPEKAWVAHAVRDDDQALAEYLRCPVLDSAGHNGLQLSRHSLQRAVRTADPALLKVLDAQAERNAQARPTQTTLLTRVTGLIRDVLPGGGSVIERVAERLHMSARTLQRRLAEEGVVFNTLLEEFRRAQALKLIENTDHPLGEVAFLLGYSDVRAFSRAFRRWTGRTPGSQRPRISR